MLFIKIIICSFSIICAKAHYNHPELNWFTIETEHFKIHYHDETETSAREAAYIAEQIYYPITKLYNYEPPTKTHLSIIDTDDISNGAAYYYDNKIIIWASPLDFELRGSHRWLQNVIAHEFVHIVSIQKSMKAGMKYPGAYLQFMGYEDEKRKDVLYGYPNQIASYPIPGATVPPWLAEGIAQYMYDGADLDHWDTHRDMIIRDRAINNNLLSFTEMNTFGKKGIGNESTYNAGFSLSRYIAFKYGSESLKNIMSELASPLQFSINDAIYNVIGIDGDSLYDEFSSTISKRYKTLTKPIDINPIYGSIIEDEGTSSLHPKWSPDGKKILYLSNKGNDFFSQTALYIYDNETKENKKIVKSIYSPASWNSDGSKIYFSKKNKFPDKNGSRFYDIFLYDLETGKESRITTGSRGFSPVVIEDDSLIAYVATKGGSQDIYLYDIKKNSIKQLTSFDERPIISELNYNSVNKSLFFDITTSHYRDIASISLVDTSFSMVFNSTLWDERNMTTNDQGDIIYSDDRSGIFNLYMISNQDSLQGYISNVTGGAFMPDISINGDVVFSLYNKGKYKISIIDSIVIIKDALVGYSPDYFMKNKNISIPIAGLNNSEEKKYEDNFPEMFIMPKIMVDYGTVKPGFYFASNEIQNRLSIFGGASLNTLKDLDLYFLFEFKRFYPTLFFETYFQTRNILENSIANNAYSIDSNIKFRMTMFRLGMDIPIYGTNINIFSEWQRYRAFVKERINSEQIEGGIAYDYYKGINLGLEFKADFIKPSLNSNINPSAGYSFSLLTKLENNKYIGGLDLSDAGTLVEKFDKNNLFRFEGQFNYHNSMPEITKVSLSSRLHLGYLTNTKVDSFFHFFSGGLPGLKGYPFYSIEGTRSFILDVILRYPIFENKHKKISWMIFQNSVLGAVFQIGDAWRNSNQPSFKKSAGFQWRINGFSFYNYPTAIQLEIHKGLTKFKKEIKGNSYAYGNKTRSYVKVLFNF